MKLSGTICDVMPVETGEGKSGQWKSQIFAVAYMDGSYEKTAAFKLFGDKVDKIGPKLGNGLSVEVEFNIGSRKHNDRYYTELNAWKVTVGGAAPSHGNQNQDDPGNDLPF